MAVNTVITAGARQASFQLDYLLDHPDYRPSESLMNGAIQHAERGTLRGRIAAIVGLALGVLGLVGVIAVGNVISGALIAIGLIGALYGYFCKEAANGLKGIQAKWIQPQLRPMDCV